MPVPVTELVGELARQVRLPEAVGNEDVYLRSLVADFESNSAMFKRDMRRLLERDPTFFLRSACRVLKESSEHPGAA